MDLEEQLRKLEKEMRLARLPIIHNTPAAMQRFRQVQSKVPWRGREIALEQEEPNYG